MGWVGVDLDGTLAEHYWPQKGAYHPTRVGEPVPAMLERVRRWLDQGVDVRIFTARVGNDHGDPRLARLNDACREAIDAWCREHLGRELPVTATKDFEMAFLYDDRAVGIVQNTGEIVGGRDPFDPFYDQSKATGRGI